MAQSTSAALRIIFGADTGEFDKALGLVQRRLKKTGKNLKKTGRTLSASVTAPLAAIGASSFQTAARFEASMAKVKAVSGATGDEFAMLRDKALELGRSTVFTASEVAALELEFSKLGFTAAQIDKVTESTLYLAQATGSDLATAAEVAGATLRGFGLDASETQRVTDVMAASFSASALDMTSFRESMKYVAPVAKSAGLSLEEATAMLAALANSGIKGSQAGTALRRILSQLAGTGEDVGKEIAKLANKGLNLADAKDEVGRSAQTALLILAESLGPTAALTEQFQHAEGAAGGMASTMNDTADGALKRMNSALEGAAIQIGNALTPVITDLAKFVEDLANKFTNLDDGTKRVILRLAGLAAAVGPLLIVLGSVATTIASLAPLLAGAGIGMTALLGPVGLLAAAVTTVLTVAFVTAGRESKKLKDKLSALKEEFPEATDKQIDLTRQMREFEAVLDSGATVTDGFRTQIRKLVTSQEDRNKLTKKADELDKKHRKTVGQLRREMMEQDETLSSTRAQFLAQQQALKNAGDEFRDYLENLHGVTVEQLNVGRATTSTTAATTEGGNAAETAAEKEARLAKELKERAEAEQTAADAAARKAAGIKAMVESTTTAGQNLGLDPDQLNIDGLLGKLGEGASTGQEFQFAMQSAFLATAESATQAEETVSNAMDQMAEKTALLARLGNVVGESFGTGMAALITGSKSGKAAITEMVGSMVSGALRASQANIIAAMTNAGIASGPAAPFVIPAMVASGIALVEGLFASLPALKDGGLTMGPQLALIGDNPSGKEAVIPFERMGQFLQMAGATSDVTVTGRLQGMDLLLSSDRAKTSRNRFT